MGEGGIIQSLILANRGEGVVSNGQNYANVINGQPLNCIKEYSCFIWDWIKGYPEMKEYGLAIQEINFFSPDLGQQEIIGPNSFCQKICHIFIRQLALFISKCNLFQCGSGIWTFC